MNSVDNRLRVALLLLRLGVFIVMIMWTLDKFVAPDHAAGIFATPAPTAGPFATFRSEAGLQAVLEENMFVEQLLIGGLEYYLTEEDKAEYRRPFAEPGPSRWPTLEWPRQLPMGGEPRDTEQLVMSYTRWLREDRAVPKLFVRAQPGAILGNPQLLEYVRSFANQREVSVYGGHYVQEVSPDAIGRALAEWIVSLQ